MAWSIIRAIVAAGGDEGWEERFRQALLHGEAHKTQRTIVRMSLLVCYASLCASVIAGQPSRAPIPSYFNVEALPR
ncbi:hypothetical protein BBX50_25450 [Ensifer sp. LC11]|nr:hypothetical protein BBX50_25450 [Ensifer sp. LC11]